MPVVGEVRVTIEAPDEGPWRVRYELKTPRAELDLGEDVEGFRARRWTMETKGAQLVRRGQRDVVTPANGDRTLRALSFLVEPARSDLRKDYEPFMPMGDGGVLFYTGHFIPFADATRRLDARLTIIAGEGRAVSAFDRTAPRFDDWESPLKHPAFVYIGRATPVRAEAMTTITDSAAPDWIRDEVADFAPAIAAALQDILARALPMTPNIFVAVGDLSPPGKLSYSGDALPGQYQMTLAGGGWKEKSDQALNILRLSTAHETAHLWQAATRPISDAAPSWIHEGGADALAAEAMVAAGYWTKADVAANFEKAKEVCVRRLEGLSLTRAETEGRWDAVYACGHVLTVAAAGEAGVGAFWRAFVAKTAQDGYDEASFMALAAENAGPDALKAMGDLIRINEAHPEATIARALAGAGDLAAGQGD